MRLALSDDHRIFSNSLAQSLEQIGADVVINVPHAAELLNHPDISTVDAAVVDVRYDTEDAGIPVASDLRARYPHVAVMLLTGYPATAQAVELVREHGAGLGYLDKASLADPAALKADVERLLNGEIVIDPTLFQEILQTPRKQSELAILTDRETDVLQLMAQGFSNAGIARNLHLAVRTVEDYCGRVFHKLGLADTPEVPAADLSKRTLAVLKWLQLNGQVDAHPTAIDVRDDTSDSAAAP